MPMIFSGALTRAGACAMAGNPFPKINAAAQTHKIAERKREEASRRLFRNEFIFQFLRHLLRLRKQKILIEPPVNSKIGNLEIQTASLRIQIGNCSTRSRRGAGARL
jgi:hypothetical protein